MIPRRGWQNGVLLGASYVFYGWWDWRFCFLMLGSSLIDYIAGVLIHRASSEQLRKVILTTAIFLNLLVLGIFKYFNFFVDSLVIALATFGLELQTTTFSIVLPVGISFYTLQTMSYTIDIYRRNFEPQRNLIDYLCFVSFFPQLVAGPIERAINLLPQFQVKRIFSDSSARSGLQLMLWGLMKKMLIADNIGPIVDSAFNAPSGTSGLVLAVATVLFAFQIYCDFSAYSDIAAGTAALFGITLMRNFNYPYFSQSITEFWRRWHISLSTWFRDYLYFPMGGNRGSIAKTCRNLILICLLSGLWHGASWNFIAWGLLHGIYLTAERLTSWHKRVSSNAYSALGGMSLTFLLVCLAWIFFRASSLPEALLIIGKIFTEPGSIQSLFATVHDHPFALSSVAALLTIEFAGRHHWNPLPLQRLPKPLRWAAYTIATWTILLFGTGRTAEFIYFRF